VRGLEVLAGLVRFVRGERVMLDSDLAGLRGGATSDLVAGAISSTKSSAYSVSLNNAVTELAC